MDYLPSENPAKVNLYKTPGTSTAIPLMTRGLYFNLSAAFNADLPKP
jgi:hypothetical protein